MGLFLVSSCQKEQNLHEIDSITETEKYLQKDETKLAFDEFNSNIFQTYSDYFKESDKSSISFDWFYDRSIKYQDGSPSLIDKESLRRKVLTYKASYDELGFDGFVNTFLNENKISTTVAKELKTINTALLVSFENNDGFDQSLSILEDKINSIEQNETLTEKDQTLLLVFSNFLHTTLDYFNKNEIPESTSPYGSITKAGCNNNTLDTGISGIAGALLGMGIYNAHLQAGGAIIAGLSVPVVGIAAAVIGIAAYCWGDDIWCWISGNGCDVDCTAPTAINPVFTDCNTATLYAFGGGEDITGYIWNNVNGSPETATTLSSSLVVNVIDESQGVLSTVTAVCSDGTTDGIVEGLIDFPDPNTPAPDIYIVNAPSNAVVNQPVKIFAAYGTSGIFETTWNIPGGIIVNSADNNYWVEVQFFYGGTRTVTVVHTNICSGLSTSDSASIFVN